jgi:hypothetical protein
VHFSSLRKYIVWAPKVRSFTKSNLENLCCKKMLDVSGFIHSLVGLSTSIVVSLIVMVISGLNGSAQPTVTLMVLGSIPR